MTNEQYHCGCGAWLGECCEWTGSLEDMVVVEYMPEYLRASHRAAGNTGSYPHNGSMRVAVETSCAQRLFDCYCDDDEDDCHCVDDAAQWSEITGLAPGDYAEGK